MNTGASPRQLLARRWSQAQHRDGRRACTASGGQPSTYIGSLSSQGLKFGVVAARFNELVTKPLLEGVLEGLERHGTQRDTVTVSSLICRPMLSLLGVLKQLQNVSCHEPSCDPDAG